DFLDMERRWLSLAHNYEFAERLSGNREGGIAADSARRLTPTAYRCGHLPVRGVPPSRDRNSARQWPCGRLQLSAAISGLRVTLRFIPAWNPRGLYGPHPDRPGRDLGLIQTKND